MERMLDKITSIPDKNTSKEITEAYSHNLKEEICKRKKNNNKTKPTADIILNGKRTNVFPLRAGTRHKCWLFLNSSLGGRATSDRVAYLKWNFPCLYLLEYMQVPNCLLLSDRMNREVTYRRTPSQKPKEYNLPMLFKNFWLTWQFLTNDDFILGLKFGLTLIQFEFSSIQILHSISPKSFCFA